MEFTIDQTGGSLEGYNVSYKIRNSSKSKNKTLPAYPPWYTMENLKSFTEYEVEVLVYNKKGRSPLANIICKTEDGKPRLPPQNIKAYSHVGETSISLSWQHAPDHSTRGTREGYKLLYWKVSDAGISVNDTATKRIVFSAHVTSCVVDGLDRYSKYCFQVLVFNKRFDGVPSKTVCAETCRCHQKFYTNWFVRDPYVVTSSTGIFPPLIKHMIYDVCGICQAYGRVLIDFETDGRGDQARKNTSKQVLIEKVTTATQVSFPVIGPVTGSTGRAGSFIPIIDNPRSVFITRKPVVNTVAQFVIGKVLVESSLPLFALTIVLLLLGAILMWFVESRANEDTFPKPFFKGVQEGFWWAFVSVTTVGYGDKVPTSIMGRIFSIIWILYGTVLIGLMTVSLSTALTATLVTTTKKVQLYGSKVAAIENSSEIQLGLLKGAHVNRGRNFSDVNSVLKAVENGDVDGAIIDKLVAARLEALRDPNSKLMVKDIIQNPSAYGVFLTGHANKLHKKFRQNLKNSASFVTSQIKSYSEPLPKGTVSNSKQDQGQKAEQGKKSQQSVISASSPIFLPLLLWTSAILIFLVIIALVWQFIYYKHVAGAAKKKNEVCPVVESKADVSSLREFGTDIGKEMRQKLLRMKLQHIKELKALSKRPVFANPSRVNVWTS